MISKKDTLFLKGLSILFLLYHHNYFAGPLFSAIQYNARIIVWVFLFITAYGFTAQFESMQKKYPIRFVIKRLVLLYIPLWICNVFNFFIHILVNPNETIAFYSGSPSTWILDFFNIPQYFGTPSFLSGWYIDMLILLIVLFPFIYLVVSKARWFAIPITYIFICLFKWKIYYEFGGYLDSYIMIYIIGILFYKYKVFSYLPKIKTEWRIPIAIMFFLAILAALCYRTGYISYVNTNIFLRSDPVSTILAIAVIAGVYILRKDDNVSLVFEKLGCHSANIFYVHSVIYNDLFPALRISNPFFTFSLCLTISLSFSVIIEKIKDHIGINLKLRNGLDKILRIR